MTRKSTTENGYVVETFGLNNELHEIASNMVNVGVDSFGNFTLEEADDDMVDSWIDNARKEGDSDYERFLSGAQQSNVSIYTLNDHVGDFSQALGDVAVSYKTK